MNMEKIWSFFGMLVLAAFITTLLLWISSTKTVIKYELSGDYGTGVPKITKNIENFADETIQLSKEITWSQAINIVDSLNATLKKYPTK